MDGQSLTGLLHKRGINIRYLGQIAERVSKSTNHRVPALKRLAVQEMLSRAFKHVANSKLRHLPPVFAPSCVAHLLNCFLGTGLDPKPIAEPISIEKKWYPEGDFSYESVTPESLWEEIIAQISLRYRYDVDKSALRSDGHFQMLREVSLKLGLQLVAKEYVFTKDQAASNGNASDAASTNGASKKKKKNGQRAASPSAPTLTFHKEDVLNIVPVVKDASPKSALAGRGLRRRSSFSSPRSESYWLRASSRVSITLRTDIRHLAS